MEISRHTCDPFHFIYFFVKNYELFYHFNHSITTATSFFDHQIFNTITQIRKQKKQADSDSIDTQILKIDDFRDVTRDYLEIKIKILLEEDIIKNKISNNLDLYYLNKLQYLTIVVKFSIFDVCKGPDYASKLGPISIKITTAFTNSTFLYLHTAGNSTKSKIRHRLGIYAKKCFSLPSFFDTKPSFCFALKSKNHRKYFLADIPSMWCNLLLVDISSIKPRG